MKKLAKILPLFRNFYFVVGMIAFVWIAFFDRYNLMDRVQTAVRIESLRDDLAFYKDERDHIEDTRNLMESDLDEIERFAREHYMMKRDNEDLFLVNEE